MHTTGTIYVLYTNGHALGHKAIVTKYIELRSVVPLAPRVSGNNDANEDT